MTGDEALLARVEAKALAEVAKTNDPAAMGKQFGKMAKLGCGGCHRPFRGPKNK